MRGIASFPFFLRNTPATVAPVTRCRRQGPLPSIARRRRALPDRKRRWQPAEEERPSFPSQDSKMAAICLRELHDFLSRKITRFFSAQFFKKSCENRVKIVWHTLVISGITRKKKRVIPPIFENHTQKTACNFTDFRKPHAKKSV